VTFLTFLNGPTATVFRTALLRLFSVRPDSSPPPPPLAAGPEVAATLGSSQQQPLARLALTNLMIERRAIPSSSETSSLTTAAFLASQLPVPGNRILTEDQIIALRFMSSAIYRCIYFIASRSIYSIYIYRILLWRKFICKETSSLTTAAFSANQLPVHGKNPFLSTDQIMERNRCCVLLQLMPKNGGFLCCSVLRSTLLRFGYRSA
jgi:hypothetical protein